MLLDHVFAFSTFDRMFTLYLARYDYYLELVIVFGAHGCRVEGRSNRNPVGLRHNDFLAFRARPNAVMWRRAQRLCLTC